MEAMRKGGSVSVRNWEGGEENYMAINLPEPPGKAWSRVRLPFTEADGAEGDGEEGAELGGWGEEGAHDVIRPALALNFMFWW